MKKLIISAVFVLMAVALGSAQKKDKSMDDTLMTMEKQAWDAFGKGDGKIFESFATDDFQIIGDNGITGKADTIKAINTKPCDLKSYSFSNFKTTMLNKETVLVTYNAVQDGSCGGQAMPGKLAVSSIYVKRNGKWLGAFHQESTVMMMPE